MDGKEAAQRTMRQRKLESLGLQPDVDKFG